MKPLFRFVAITAIWGPAFVGLTACTTSVALTPAEHATSADCASVVVRLPDTVGGLGRHETNAQGTGAWGSPSGALLFCGVKVPGPSTLLCYRVNGIDWLFDPKGDPNMSYTTFGRDPAVQVIVNDKVASPGNVLNDLSDAVSQTPATGHQCASVAETLGDGTGSPAATPSPSASPAG